MCGEAEYLTGYGVDLKIASLFHRRFTPRQIVELWQAGVQPELANMLNPQLNALQIIDVLDKGVPLGEEGDW